MRHRQTQREESKRYWYNRFAHCSAMAGEGIQNGHGITMTIKTANSAKNYGKIMVNRAAQLARMDGSVIHIIMRSALWNSVE